MGTQLLKDKLGILPVGPTSKYLSLEQLEELSYAD